MIEKTCVECQELYLAYKKDQLYCRLACSRKAKRERHRDTDNARRRQRYAEANPGSRLYSSKNRKVSLQFAKVTQPIDIAEKMEKMGYF